MKKVLIGIIFIIIFFTPNLMFILIHFSSMVDFFRSKSGFGVFKVSGFNLLPNPAHKINEVLIFIQFFFKAFI